MDTQPKDCNGAELEPSNGQNLDWKAFESSRAPKLLIDAQTGEIVNANPAACAFYGYNRAKLCSLRIWDINTLGEADTRRRMRQVAAGDCATFQFEHRLASGEIRNVEVFSGSVHSGGRQLLSSIIVDVTDHRRADESLRESRESMANAFEKAPIGMAMVSPKGRWIKVNGALCDILGYSEGELLGKPLDDVTFPEDLDADRAHVQRMLEGKMAAYPMEKRYRHKSGRGVWALLHVSLVRNSQWTPLYFVLQVQDITLWKEAERRQKMMLEILVILNKAPNLQEAATRTLAVIRQETGIEAAGIRIARDHDFPYLAQEGFSQDFVASENRLCARSPGGDLQFGPDGKAMLECTCGLVIEGRTDPANPLFSPGGSAWNNDGTAFADPPAGQDPRRRPRNRCLKDGYKSVALIPIRSGSQTVGLLHLADRRPHRFSPQKIVFLEGMAASIGIAVAHRQAEEIRREYEERFLAADPGQGYPDPSGRAGGSRAGCR